METLTENLIDDGYFMEQLDDTPKLLNKVQIAERLSVTVRTIENWMDQGKIPYYKLGKIVRFDWDEVWLIWQSKLHHTRKQ